MNTKKYISFIALAMITVLMAASSMVFGQDNQEMTSSDAQNTQEGTSGPVDPLVGVWRSFVTMRNCQTGVPLAPAVAGLFTINSGGTMVEHAGSPIGRSAGHGIWRRESGAGNYTITFTILRYDAAGLYTGRQRIRAITTLADGGAEFVTNSSIDIYDAADNLTLPVRCATGDFKRFE